MDRKTLIARASQIAIKMKTAPPELPIRKIIARRPLLPETILQQLARAARVTEQRLSFDPRTWVVIFLNEKTVVIAVHGLLTKKEQKEWQTSEGATRVEEFHQRLFSNKSALLYRQIKRITGMEVTGTTVEFKHETCSVVHFITTNTMGEKFSRASIVSRKV